MQVFPRGVGLGLPTVLHQAAWRGDVSVVSKLLGSGEDKDMRNGDGATPLYLAAYSGQLEVIEKLLAAKADPDIRAYDTAAFANCRPLDVAAVWGHLEILRALLRHGSDSQACDDDGNTALHRAVATSRRSESEPDGAAIRALLEAGANINAKRTTDGASALHLAVFCRSSSIDTMFALLQGGADVNSRASSQGTPLHIASYSSNFRGVELLLRWGADESLVNEDGDKAENLVGTWKQDGDKKYKDKDRDDEHILHLLARAPAKRLRGLLVLARCRPDKVQITNDNRSSSSSSSISSSSGGSSANVATAYCHDLGVEEGDQVMNDVGSLVKSVVGLDAEIVFRLVVGFL